MPYFASQDRRLIALRLTNPAQQGGYQLQGALGVRQRRAGHLAFDLLFDFLGQRIANDLLPAARSCSAVAMRCRSMSFNSVLVAIMAPPPETHPLVSAATSALYAAVRAAAVSASGAPALNCCNVGIIACHAGLPVDRQGLHGL